jgi:hypothetical protein
LRRYLWSNARELSCLRSLTFENLFRLKKLRIEFADEQNPYQCGNLLFTHGSIVRKWAAYTAKAHYEKYGCCVIHGHTHRMGSFYHRTFIDTYGAWENGCLCTLNPEYAVCPDWQQGFSVVWFTGDRFHVQQVPIIDGQFVYHGKLRR